MIPEASTDFIFAAIGEEIGLIGVTALLITYLLMGKGRASGLRYGPSGRSANSSPPGFRYFWLSRCSLWWGV